MDFFKWLRTYMPTPETKFRPSSDYDFVYWPGNLHCYTVIIYTHTHTHTIKLDVTIFPTRFVFTVWEHMVERPVPVVFQ